MMGLDPARPITFSINRGSGLSIVYYRVLGPAHHIVFQKNWPGPAQQNLQIGPTRPGPGYRGMTSAGSVHTNDNPMGYI